MLSGDTGQLAGIVIARVLYRQLNVVDENIFQDVLLVGGIAAVAVCFILGIILVKREIKSPTSLAEKTRFRRRKRSKR